MPIYEYRCEACGHEFEELVRGDEAIACPRCAAERSRKKLSTFATAGSAAAPRGGRESAPAGGCGTCGDPVALPGTPTSALAFAPAACVPIALARETSARGSVPLLALAPKQSPPAA